MIHTENLTKSYKSGLMSRTFVLRRVSLRVWREASRLWVAWTPIYRFNP